MILVNLVRQCAASIYRNVSACVRADYKKVNATYTEPGWRQVAVDVYALPSTALQ